MPRPAAPDDRDPSSLGRERSVRYITAIGYAFLGLVLVWALFDHQRRTIEIDAPPPAATDAHRAIDETLDPNQAAWYELSRLPGIGEVMAKRIVALRNEIRDNNPTHRPFQTADDLQAVRGIGPKTAEKLRPYLRFDSQIEGSEDEK